MQFETLHTPRLQLYKLTDEDYEELLLKKSDEEVTKYLGIAPEKVSAERKKAKKGFSTFNKTLLLFHITEKGSDKVIGWCGFHTWYRDHDRAEIGYVLSDDAYKAKGIMTEALREVIKYGFEQMGLKRIEAFIGPNNTPSLKLIEKFGFQKEGYLRKHYRSNGKLEDSVLYALLVEDYNPNTA